MSFSASDLFREKIKLFDEVVKKLDISVSGYNHYVPPNYILQKYVEIIEDEMTRILDALSDEFSSGEDADTFKVNSIDWRVENSMRVYINIYFGDWVLDLHDSVKIQIAKEIRTLFQEIMDDENIDISVEYVHASVEVSLSIPNAEKLRRKLQDELLEAIDSFEIDAPDENIKWSIRKAVFRKLTW